MPRQSTRATIGAHIIPPTTLVLGPTGATGRLLVRQLLEGNHQVKAILRNPDRLSGELRNHPNLHLIHTSLLDLDELTLAEHLKDCTAVASCLGHTPSLKGIYGQPRRLVRDAVRRVCRAIRANAPERPLRFVLMNTAGTRNRDLDEPLSLAHKSLLALIRLLLPPHVDNEQAAEVLRSEIGQADPFVQWAVVRPDTLLNEEQVSQYKVHPSPTRSALFDAGKTSRINVAHFMAELLSDDEAWQRWKGRMPVIYNAASE